MVMYDSYESKIKKVAIVKNFVVKFKVFFIALTITIVALTSGFLGTKGVITENVSLPPEIVYGEEIVLEEAKALFNKEGSIYYEFFDPTTGQWSTEVPSAPGTYQVRTVTTKSFDTKGYGQPVTFVIQPKAVDFIIKDTEVEYGQNPVNYTLDLVNGDKLVKEEVSFIFDSVVLKETQVQADINTVKIVDKNGVDVTDRYQISTPKTDIRYVAKTIEIAPLVSSKVYDGTPISYSNEIEEASINSLIEGDTLTIKTSIKNEKGEVLTSNPIDVGTYTIVIDTYDITNNGQNNNGNYKVNLKTAKFSITKRDITITTASHSKAFDGTELYLDPNDSNNVTITNIVEGHKLSLDTSYNEKVAITNVGSVENKYKYNVLNAANQDVTNNYNITYTYGTLQVYSNEISVVVSDNLEKTYDQKSFNISDISWSVSDNFPQGFNLRVNSSNIEQFINAGTHDFTVSFDIVNDLGEDVTDQFTFIGVDENGNYQGRLTINKKNAIVTINPIEKVYDGEEVTYQDVTYICEGLLDDNVFNITSFKDPSAMYLYAGTYEYNVDYVIMYENYDVKQNYNVKIHSSTITINKKEININVEDVEKEYDAKTFDTSDITYNVLTTLPSGHYVELANIEVLSNTTYPNVGVYEYKSIFVVKYGNEIVSDSFIINANNAKATINKFDLEVSLYALSKTYDANYYEIENIYDVLDINKTLPENVVLVMLTDTIQNNDCINVGTYTFDATFDLLLNGHSVLDNFTVKVNENELVISQKEVTVTTASDTFVYDGYNHVNRSISAEGLIAGHTVKINTNQNDIEICNVGTIENNYSYTIFDENNKDVTSNYLPIDVIGILEVTPFTLVVKPVEMDSVVYDGTYYSYDSSKYEIITDMSHINKEIKDSITISLQVYFHLENETNVLYEVIDAGTYKMEIESILTNYSNNFVLEEYDDGMYFEIEKYKYTIDDLLVDYDLIYGDQPEVKEHSLVKENKVIPQVVYVEKQDYEANKELATKHSEIYDAGTYYVNCVGFTVIGNENNYEITIGVEDYTSTILINKRVIYVNLYEIDGITYSGEYLYYPNNSQVGNFNYASDSSVLENKYNRLLDGESIAFVVTFIKDGNTTVTYEQVKDAGTYTYSYTIELLTGRSLNNYIINVMNADADFTINKRDVYITTNDIGVNEKTYDGQYVYYPYGGDNNFAYYGDSVNNIDNQLVIGENLTIDVTFVLENDSEQTEFVQIVNAGTYKVLVSDYTVNDALLLDNYNLVIIDDKVYQINKKDVYVTFASDSREYNGEALINKNYDVEGLASTDYITLSGKDVTVTDVDQGNVENVYTVNISSPYTNIEKDSAESEDVMYDVTLLNYNLSVTSGILKILPRTVYVKPLVLDDVIYNGQPIEYPSNYSNFNYDLLSSDEEHQMVDGQELTIYIYYMDAFDNKLDYAPYNVGLYHIYIETELNNVVPQRAYDVSNGKEDNYKIIFEERNSTSFVINPRPITIHGKLYEDRLYDGTTTVYESVYGNYRLHEDSEYDIVSGHKLTVEGYFEDLYGNLVSPKDAATYYVKVKEDLFTLVDAKGEDVLFNYNITVEFDEDDDSFIINPREVEVTLNSIKDKVYDGVEVTYDTYVGNYEIAGKDGLVVGEYLEVEVGFIITNPNNIIYFRVKNAATYHMVITDYTISGTNNVKGNYIISEKEPLKSFVISPKEISIKTNDIIDKTYDGLETKYETMMNNYNLLESDSLVSGEFLTLIIKFEDLNTNEQTDSVVNTGVYEIIIYDYIISGSNYVEENYKLVQKEPHETYTIKQRVLTITPSEYEVIYNGYDQEVTNDFVYLDKGEGTIEDQYLPEITVDVKAVVDGKESDTVHNASTYVSKITSHTNSDPHNFKIVYEDSEAIVVPKEYDLRLNEQYVITYGEKFTSTPIETGLGDDVIVVYVTQYEDDINQTEIKINAGTYNVVATKYGYENTLQSNYVLPNVKDVLSELVIKPMELTVDLLMPDNNNREYDGKETTYKTGVGNYANLYDVEGKKVTTLPYNDEIEVYAGLYQNGNKVVAKDAGDYEVVYEGYDVKEGNIVYGNYIITQRNVGLTYTIKPRNIYINPIDIDAKQPVIYDGETVVYPDGFNNFVYAGISEMYLAHQMVAGELLSINVYYVDEDGNEVIPIDHDTYYIKIKLDEFNVENGKTSNYIIHQVDDVSFVITQRIIEVTLTDIADKTYDGLATSYDVFAGNYDLAGKDGLADGETLTIKVEFINLATDVQSASVINTGVYEMVIVEYIISGANDKEENYIFIQKEPHETYTIKQRVLTITPSEYEVIYNGYDQEVTNDFVYLDKGEGTIEDQYLPEITVDVKAVVDGKESDTVHNAATYVSKITSHTNSDPHNFKIVYEDSEAIVVPKEYDLRLNEQYVITYGEKFTSTPIETGLGDDVIVVYVTQYEDDINQTEIKINAGTYNVVATKYGYENTLQSNYVLPNVKDVLSELVIKPMELTVDLLMPDNNNREYDGKETTYKTGVGNYANLYDVEGKKVTTLPYNDEIEVYAGLYQNGNKVVAKDAGDYEVVYEGYDVKEGNIVYGNYIITQRNVGLTYTIKPRIIKVILNEITDKVYDGIEVSYDTYLSNYERLELSDLVYGEFLEVEVKFADNTSNKNLVSTVRNAGTYYMYIVDYSICGTNNVKSNYELVTTYPLQSFTISPKKVFITLNDYEDITYNGEEFVYGEAYGNYDISSSTSIVDGELLLVKVEYINSVTGKKSPSIKDAGTYELVIVDHEITGTNDVRDNYIVKQNIPHQTFEIKQRVLTITPSEYEVTYNGYEQKVTDDFIYLDKGEGAIEDQYLPEITVDVKVVVDGVKKDSVKDAGTYETVIDSYTISDSDNFVLNIKNSEAIIKAYDYDLRLEESYSITYGQTLTEIVIETGLGDDAIVVYVIQFEDDINNTFVAVNAGVYNMVATGYEFENTVATNYNLPDVTGVISELIIDTLVIYVELNMPDNNNREYDGKETTYKNYVGNYAALYDKEGDEIQSLPYGDTLQVKAGLYQDGLKVLAINAGTYSVKLEDYVIISNNDVPTNYDIRQKNNDLTYSIKPRTIYINPYNIENEKIEYNGQPITYIQGYDNYYYAGNSVSNKNYQMVDGERLSINVYYVDLKGNVVTPINAGTYYIFIDTETLDVENGLASNYKVIQVENNVLFEITPRVLVLAIENDSKVFDGYSYTRDGNDYTVVSGEIVPTDELRIKVVFTVDNYVLGSVRNVGLYDVELNYVYIEGETTPTVNYVATLDDEYTFEITPRTMYLKPTPQAPLTYNGQKQTVSNEKYFTEESLDGLNPADIPVFKVEILAYAKNSETGEIELIGKDYVLDAGTYITRFEPIDFKDPNFIIVPLEGELVVNPYTFNMPFESYYDIVYGETMDEKMFKTGINDEQIGLKLYQLDENGNRFIAENAGVYEMFASEYIYANNAKASNYIIKPQLTDINSILEIKPKVLYAQTYEFEDDGREYDGKYTTYQTGKGNYVALYDEEGNVVTELPYNGEIEVLVRFVSGSSYVSVKDASTYNVVIEEWNAYKNGVNIPSNYLIHSYYDEVYTINPRTIHVAPIINNPIIIYDGKEHPYDEQGTGNFVYYTTDINHQLVAGEDISINVDYYLVDEDGDVITLMTPINVGKYQALVNDTLEDGVNGKASNYKVVNNPTPIYIEIIPRQITYELSNTNGIVEIDYDGYYHYENEFDSFRILENSLDMPDSETVDIKLAFVDESGKEVTRIKEVGTYKLVVKDYIISGGQKDKNNYEFISNKEVYVVINKLNVRVGLYGDKKVTYDGKEHYYTYGCEILKEDGEFADINPDVLEGLEIEIEVEFINKDGVQTKYAKDAGTYELVVVSKSCNKNDSINVVFDLEDKKYFYVEKYKHTIQLNPDDVEYGDELTYTFENELVNGEMLEFSVQYYDGKKVVVIPAQVNTYDIDVIESSYVYKNGAKKDNYDILVENYTIDIVPRIIFVDLLELEDTGRVYDDTMTYYITGSDNFEYATNRQAVKDENLELVVNFVDENGGSALFAKNANTYHYEIVSWKVTGGNANSNNYLVIQNNPEQTYIINKVKLTVDPKYVLPDIEYGQLIEYPSEIDNYYLFDGQLVGNQKLQIYISIVNQYGIIYDSGYIDEWKYFNVGNYKVIVDTERFEIINGFSSNYELINADFMKYEFTISPQEVILEYIQQPEVIYTGYNYSYPTDARLYSLISGNILSQESIFLDISLIDANGKEYTSVTEAGTYYAVFNNDWEVYGHNNSKDNYVVKVSGNNNKYIVNKRDLYISPDVANKIYNGLNQYVEDEYVYLEEYEYILRSVPDLKVDVKAMTENGLSDTVLDADTYTAYIAENVSGYNTNNYNIVRETQTFIVSPYSGYKVSLDSLQVDGKYVYGDISSNQAIKVYPFKGSDDYIEVFLSIKQNGVVVDRPNVGNASYTITSINIVNSKPTNYINIDTSESKSVEITKRKVSIKLNDIIGTREELSMKYGDFIRHESYEYTIKEGSFAYDETMILLISSKDGIAITSSGVSYKLVSIGNNFVIAGGNGLASNYQFEFKTGVILIY